MHKLGRLFLMTLLFATSTIIAFARASEDETTRYLARMNTDGSVEDVRTLFLDHGFEIVKRFEQINVFVVSHQSQQDVQNFRDTMKEKLAYLEEDYAVEAIRSSNDPMFSEQNSLKRLGVTKAWNFSTGSYDVVIAVSDTGINTAHQELMNQIWTNFDEIPNNEIDDDGNGYVDDVSGWNFYQNNKTPEDDNGHGTHVSGIIGAEGDNFSGISGVNWNVQIMPLKFLSSTGRGSTSGGIATILYAADNGAHILNASWGGGGDSTALKEAIDYGLSKGMLVIAAAGNNSSNNDNTPFFPAGTDSDGVIAVASSQREGSLSSFSNFGGSTIHFAAPGSNVLSTYLGDDYKRLSGTSMAAPMVSGVAGLLLSVEPALSGLVLKNALLNSVISRESYKGLLLTEGDLDASKTLSELQNDKLKIWPGKLALKDGTTFQFSAFKHRGVVTWEVEEEKKGLATIDANGLLTTTKGKNGEFKVVAVDEQGNRATTQSIVVVQQSGGRSGGGCTREVHASDSSSQRAGKPSDLLGYVLLVSMIICVRNRKSLKGGKYESIWSRH